MERTQKADAHRLWVLFKTCFVISCCTFGGGLVIISMLQKKFVEELGWIEQEEVMDMVAIAQSCPGVMAVNTSIIIGYRIGGVCGALLTALGTVTPPMIILTIVSLFYAQFRSNYVIALLLKGMQAGVAAVMINVTVTMCRNVLKDRKLVPVLLLIGSSVAAVVFQVDIIVIILVCAVIGGYCNLTQSGRQGTPECQERHGHERAHSTPQQEQPSGTSETALPSEAPQGREQK